MKKIFALVCLTLLVAGQAVGRSEWREKAAGQSGGATSRGEASSELAEAARLNSEVVKLFAAGKYDEALPLARRVLEIREKALGDNILDVYALNNLASIYTGKGKDGEAEPLFRRSLAVLEKIGAGVSDVAAEVNTRLGVLKLRGGNYKEAEPFLRRALEILEKGHGADDPSVVPALLNIADLYLLRRDSAAFIGVLDRAATIINNQPPRKDAAVATRLNNYLCPVMSVAEGKELSNKLGRAAFRLEEPEKAAELEKQRKEGEGRGEGDEQVVEGGVLQGSAISKPQPVYPAEAKQQRIMGVVVLKIVVDETGKVVRAEKVCGHPLLVKAAIEAALKARFTPTLLSGMPVKVSGVITYHFVLQ